MSGYISKAKRGLASKSFGYDPSFNSHQDRVVKDYRSLINTIYYRNPGELVDEYKEVMEKGEWKTEGLHTLLTIAAALAKNNTAHADESSTSQDARKIVNSFVETILTSQSNAYSQLISTNPEFRPVVEDLLEGYVDCPSEAGDRINRVHKFASVRDATSRFTSDTISDPLNKVGVQVTPLHALMLKASHRAGYLKHALAIMSKPVVSCNASSADASASGMVKFYFWGAQILLSVGAVRHALIWVSKAIAIQESATPSRATSMPKKRLDALHCIISVAVMGELPAPHDSVEPCILSLCKLCCAKQWREFEQKCEAFTKDASTLECTKALQAMRKCYEEYLVCKMADTYSRIRLSEVAKLLNIGSDDATAEEIVVRCIEKDRVKGTIDGNTGIVSFGEPAAVSGKALCNFADFTMLGKERVSLGWDAPQDPRSADTLGNMFATALERRSEQLHLIHTTMVNSLELSSTSPEHLFVSRK